MRRVSQLLDVLTLTALSTGVTIEDMVQMTGLSKARIVALFRMAKNRSGVILVRSEKGIYRIDNWGVFDEQRVIAAHRDGVERWVVRISGFGELS